MTSLLKRPKRLSRLDPPYRVIQPPMRGMTDVEVRAMTVVPGEKGTAGCKEVPTRPRRRGHCWCAGVAVGVCRTDREIAEGAYGIPPCGETTLVVGHERWVRCSRHRDPHT